LTQSIKLSFNEIKPYVRDANLLQCAGGFSDGRRMIYDHQFIYVHKGKGLMEINDISYTAKAGDLFYYGPGVKHSFLADAYEPYLLTGIHFDFTANHVEKLFPIGPFAISAFKKEMITERIEFTDFQGFQPYMDMSDNPIVSEVVMELVNEYQMGKIYSQAYMNGIFGKLLSIIARSVSTKGHCEENKEILINKVIKYIQDNFDKKISNEDMGAKFNFHPNYLNNLMVTHTGVSLRHFIIDYRVKKAINLLLYSNMTISSISKTVGYEDIHYFSRIITKKTGLTPGQFRRKH